MVKSTDLNENSKFFRSNHLRKHQKLNFYENSNFPWSFNKRNIRTIANCLLKLWMMQTVMMVVKIRMMFWKPKQFFPNPRQFIRYFVIWIIYLNNC